MTLTDLAKQFGCDKYFNHSYMPHYEELLGRRRVNRLLEIGIGYKDLMKPFVPFYIHGASLKMWSTYWPEAEIWACDIHSDTLINEGNIRSLVCDQSSGGSLAEMMWTASNGLKNKFDVIIDDGSHIQEHQRLTAECFLPRVASGGVYIIEDCYPDTGAEMAKRFGGRLIVGDKRPDDCLVVLER